MESLGKVSIHEALKAYTFGGAYASLRDYELNYMKKRDKEADIEQEVELQETI